MEHSDQILSQILAARESRTLLRKNIAESGNDSLSLTLNIPGYPKSNKLLSFFFTDILNDLRIFLQANRIFIEDKKEIVKVDPAGDFYLIPILKNRGLTASEIKTATELFEGKHELGRLIDIDIFDSNGNPVSSKKEKACYFCGMYSALNCMRNKRHSYEEIREKILTDITVFLKEKQKKKNINKICSMAQKALLYEISISKKPGLVCFENSGVHTDMNFFTFLNSTSALLPYFKEFCTMGYYYNGALEMVLPKIREIGLNAENSMFQATNQVNTQKGIIFLFGLSLFAISKVISENGFFSEKEFQETVKIIGRNLVKNELHHIGEPKTHGEKVFKKHGKLGTGIRQEIESGLPIIFQTALPYFSANLTTEIYKDQVKLQEILLQGLLRIMTVNNDTNILYRSNLETLNYIKKAANQSIYDQKEYKKLYEFCKTHKISPGGSADLLAVSLLLHFIKTEYNEF